VIAVAAWLQRPGGWSFATATVTMLAVLGELAAIAARGAREAAADAFVDHAVLLLCVLMPLAAGAMAVHALGWARRGGPRLAAVGIVAALLSVLMGVASVKIGLGVAHPIITNINQHQS